MEGSPIFYTPEDFSDDEDGDLAERIEKRAKEKKEKEEKKEKPKWRLDLEKLLAEQKEDADRKKGEEQPEHKKFQLFGDIAQKNDPPRIDTVPASEVRKDDSVTGSETDNEAVIDEMQRETLLSEEDDPIFVSRPEDMHTEELDAKEGERDGQAPEDALTDLFAALRSERSSRDTLHGEDERFDPVEHLKPEEDSLSVPQDLPEVKYPPVDESETGLTGTDREESPDQEMAGTVQPDTQPAEEGYEDEPPISGVASKTQAAIAGAVAGLGEIFAGGTSPGKKADKKEINKVKKESAQRQKTNKVLHKKLESHKKESRQEQHTYEAGISSLQRQIGEMRDRDAYQETALKKERAARHRAELHNRQHPETPSIPAEHRVHQERGIRPNVPQHEAHHSPNAHERVPQRHSYENPPPVVEGEMPQLTNHEQRHEIKDQPGRKPFKHAQNNQSSWEQPGPAPVRSTRDHLMSLGSSGSSHSTTNTSTDSQGSYKTAVVSGLVTAVVVLAAVLAYTLVF